MAIACKYCIMTKGLKGSELSSLPKNDEEFYNHVEKEHHIPVRREGETESQTLERFKRENPEAGGPNCKCPACCHKRDRNSISGVFGNILEEPYFIEVNDK